MTNAAVTTRLMRLLSMTRKVMADMVVEEAVDGLTPEYVHAHQRFNEEWIDNFRYIDARTEPVLSVLARLLWEMEQVVLTGEFPDKGSHWR